MVTVSFYMGANGEKPVAEFMRSLPAAERAKLAEALWRIQSYGLAGSSVTTRPIKDKLWEVKVSAQRAFYVMVTGDELVVLHAYTKKTRKAPVGDIDIATRRMNEILGD